MALTYEEYLEQNPLCAFSMYTGAQVNHLGDVASEIRENLDRGVRQRGWITRRLIGFTPCFGFGYWALSKSFEQ